jgi:hypothetical protein
MHPYMMQQLAADHVAELRADAQRTRHQRVLHARRAAEADQAPARRKWRILVHALFAR